MFIPARCFEYSYDRWSTRAGRTYLSQPHFKFFAWPSRCLCLTVDQRDRFIEKLAVLISEASAIAAAEGKAFNEAMTSVNEDRLRIATRKRPEPKVEA